MQDDIRNQFQPTERMKQIAAENQRARDEAVAAHLEYERRLHWLMTYNAALTGLLSRSDISCDELAAPGVMRMAAAHANAKHGPIEK